MLKRDRTSLLHELIVPTPGRLERTLQLVAVTSIVVLISMAYQLPEPGLSAYIVYFVSKEDSGRTILISVVFIVAIVVVIATAFLLLPHTLDQPSIRILFIAGTSFALFFLGSASKLAPLAGTLGLVLAAALNSEQSLPTGEIGTRALLYIMLVVLFPIGVQIAFNIFAGRRPDRLLREGLRSRLEAITNVLRSADKSDASRLADAVATGNSEMLAELKMAGMFHFLRKDAVARFKILIEASYGVLIAAESRREVIDPSQASAYADRLEALAARIATFPARHGSRGPATDEAHPIAALVAAMEDATSAAAIPAPSKEAAKKEKSGFFKPGAFTDPVHERFAAKATAAAMTCYLAFNIADWTKISTCLITVFIVALSTSGESRQKMTLRITGCMCGATIGYAAIVFVLPYTTEVSGLLILVACITLPAGWVAFGSPRVGYIGFQMAFCAYLCVLQGSEPKFDLTVARDRFVGILLGNVVVYVYFVSIYPVSLLPGLTRQLVTILERCNALVAAAGGRGEKGRDPVLALVGEVAEVRAMVERIDQAVIAYGFEKRANRYARLHMQACHLIQRALHVLVAEIATFATLPPAERRENHSAEIKARLQHLAGAIRDRTAIDAAGHAAAPRPAGQAVTAAIDHAIDRLSVAAARYRRIARRNEGGVRV